MSKKIQTRRNTSCVPSDEQALQDDGLEHNEEDASLSGEENDEVRGVKKNFNTDDEDVLIRTILKHYTIVENKSTDKHLTSRQLEENQLAAWKAIQDEFVKTTKVSFDVYFIFHISSSLSKFI